MIIILEEIKHEKKINWMAHLLFFRQICKISPIPRGLYICMRLSVCMRYFRAHRSYLDKNKKRHLQILILLIEFTFFKVKYSKCCKIFKMLTLRTSEAGIPTLRKLLYGVRSRYTDGTEVNARRQKSVYRLCFLLRTGPECSSHRDTDKIAAEK